MLTFKQFLVEMPYKNNSRLDPNRADSIGANRPSNLFKYRYHGSFKNPKTGKRYHVYSHTKHQIEYDDDKDEMRAMKIRSYYAHSLTSKKPSAVVKLSDRGGGSHYIDWAQSAGGFGIHHLYSHILRKDKRVSEITSGSQSPGAIKAWRQLASDPKHDVFVRGKDGVPRKSRNFDDYYEAPYQSHKIVMKKR